MEYKGITLETLFLVADNKFRDSRDFYEEHKEEIKENYTVPVRQIAAIIAPELLYLDSLMETNPVKMVSRIRRDTRFSKNKEMYRANIWAWFGRNKKQWANYPSFWFEISETDYSMGIGIFGGIPGLMQTFRKHIREKTEEFAAACKSCESAGAHLFGDTYKRLPADCPEGMEKYYIQKNFGFIVYSNELSHLADDTIIEIIKKNYKKFAPMYTFLLGVADEYFSKGEI